MLCDKIEKGKSSLIEGHKLYNRKLVNIFADQYTTLSKFAIMIVKDKDAALDVLQTVALAIVKKDFSISEIEKPTAFLIVCVRRAALNYLRKESRIYPTDPAIIHDYQSDGNAQTAMDYLEWVMALDKYLEKYPEGLRKAFVRHYVDGYPADIVARELNMTPNALAQQFKRMRKKIEQKSHEHKTLLLFLSYL
jgi:RNA polymerase sigma-70 factor (ECF subfamily)